MIAKRNTYIDFVKAILIFLVILGHVIQVIRYQGRGEAWDDALFKAIYMFHMPLFLAISGYFTFFSVKKHSAYDFLKSKFIYLFIPMMVWCLLIFIFCFFLKDLLLFVAFKRMYWFVWALILYSVLICILNKLKIDNIIVLFISIIVLVLIPYTDFQYPLIKSMYPFFVVGYLLANVDLTKIIAFLKKYFLVVLTLTVICFFLWNRNAYPYIIPSGFGVIKISVFRFLASILASITFLQITYFIYTKIAFDPIKEYLAQIGRETLGFYLVQGFAFYLYSILTVSGQESIISNDLLAVLFSIFAVAIIHFFIYFVSKNKLLGTIFFGEK